MTQMDRDRETVEKYARVLDASIYWDAEPNAAHNGPRADPLTGELHLAPWGADASNGSLWVAMHELGHLATTNPFEIAAYRIGGSRAGVAEIEAAAWLWAIEHAGRELDEVGRAEIIGALASYFQSGPPYDYVIGSPGPQLTKLLNMIGPTTATDPALVQATEPRYWRIAMRLWDQAYEEANLALAA